MPVRVVGGVADNCNTDNGEVVCGGNVGSPRWCVDGDVTVDGDGNAVPILDGKSAYNGVDFVIADGSNARADDAGVVGMGRRSGVRPWRLPILILPIVFFSKEASWYVED